MKKLLILIFTFYCLLFNQKQFAYSYITQCPSMDCKQWCEFNKQTWVSGSCPPTGDNMPITCICK